jgi:hypothetical protein
MVLSFMNCFIYVLFFIFFGSMLQSGLRFMANVFHGF